MVNCSLPLAVSEVRCDGGLCCDAFLLVIIRGLRLNVCLKLGVLLLSLLRWRLLSFIKHAYSEQ